MYEQFYRLRAKPFSLTPDPSFIFWADPHSLAFSMLEYGIVNRAGFTVITGEVGAGKTTLIRYLLSRVTDELNIGVVSNMQKGRGDLLEWVLMALNQDFETGSYVALYRRFTDHLADQWRQGRRTVLVVDEAQNLDVATLEELRMLSNVNAHDEELLQIVLSGQPELKALLGRAELTQLAQRVSSDFHLGLLNRSEVRGYIDHRLAVSGSDRPLFTDDACDLVYLASQGTPRSINALCDTALMYGYATEAPLIGSDIVRKVLEDKQRHGVFPVRALAGLAEHGHQPDQVRERDGRAMSSDRQLTD